MSAAAESSVLNPGALHLGLPTAARTGFFQEKKSRISAHDVPREVIIPKHVVTYLKEKAPAYLEYHPEVEHDNGMVRIFHQGTDRLKLEKSAIYSHIPHTGQWQMLRKGATVECAGHKAYTQMAFAKSLCRGHFGLVPGTIMGEPIAQLLAAWVIGGLQQGSLKISARRDPADLTELFREKGSVLLTEICSKPLGKLVPGMKCHAFAGIQPFSERGTTRVLGYGFILDVQGNPVVASVVEGMPVSKPEEGPEDDQPKKLLLISYR